MTDFILFAWFTFALAVATAAILAAIYVHGRHRHREYHLACMRAWHAVALHHYLKPRVPLPEAGGGWTLSPDLLSFLVRHIEAERPQHAVELGSGLSSVVLGRALKNVGGCLTSIEADLDYLAQTRALLDVEGLDNVRLIHAPLTAWNGQDWYDTQAIGETDPVDLLLVDGPPSLTAPLARYPALPFFWPRLRAGAAVVLDDGDRRDEQRIIARWCSEFPGTTATHLPLYRRPALLRKPG